jgi:hypothetical protein
VERVIEAARQAVYSYGNAHRMADLQAALEPFGTTDDPEESP